MLFELLMYEILFLFLFLFLVITWLKQKIRKTKNKQFIQLRQSVQPILFHHVLPEYKSTYFPYEKFQTLAEDFRKALTLVYVNSAQVFIWKNLIRWLTSMKLCYEGFSDLKYDERYNLILTDFMAQYMNYKCNLYSTITDETEVCRRVDEILFTLGVVFSGNVPGILMTLLKIEVKDAYRLILDPIFRKYLSNRSIHEPDDLICYLRLILCYRQWKKLSHFKEDKELINEIAVGISEKSLNMRHQHSCLPIKEPVLHKIVPPVKDNNRHITAIAGLIGFAIRNKTYGTRNFRDYRDRLSSSDQMLAVKWVNKLKSEGQSLEGAQLRNDLLNYLTKSVESGCLKSPFDQKPPHGHLISLKDILPREMKTIADNAPSQSHPKPEIFERSPDKGAFLAAQPVPRSGAFCYLAIVSRAPNCN